MSSQFTASHNISPRAAALAWLLSRPAVTSAIVSAETVDKLTANHSAVDIDIDLDPAQLDALTALTT